MNSSERIDTLERQLAILRRQLGEAQKMTALGQLVSTTTHEFNNVLMTILNYAKLGAANNDQATRDKAFAKILAASERASAITNSVLGLARNRTNEPAPTILCDIVEETLVLLERELSKYRITIEKHYDDIPPILAVGNHIQQVLLNLLINARQAMVERGTVTLRIEQGDDMGHLVVRDSGPGIAAEKLRRIFDPFFTTKDGPDETGKGGSGLGLAACRDIIEAHNGRIRVESTPGVGTQFTIMLPLASADTNRLHNERKAG